MLSGRDSGCPVAAGDERESAVQVDIEFVGPLRRAHQAWAEQALRADNAAAAHESSDNVIRRREARIAGLYRMAAVLTLSGDLAGSGAAGFRAVAESRALAEFMAANPAYCLDCFLLGDRCQRHQPDGTAESAGTPDAGSADRQPNGGSGHQPGHQPEWRRFGADESPSANG
ncbi:MAG: hypothetical protein ACJ74U_06585 [Jatrophihabitantaceae bacterium]